MRIGGIRLPKHFNLYYLLLEDSERRRMPESRANEIQKNILLFYKKIKPEGEEIPLISAGGAPPAETDEHEKTGGMQI